MIVAEYRRMSSVTQEFGGVWEKSFKEMVGRVKAFSNLGRNFPAKDEFL